MAVKTRAKKQNIHGNLQSFSELSYNDNDDDDDDDDDGNNNDDDDYNVDNNSVIYPRNYL